MAFFSGRPAEFKQLPSLNPQQQALQSSVAGQAQSLLGQNLADFGPIEAQARRGFQTQTLPSIAERFTSLGGPSAQKSSAFQGALGGAASDLESRLAALRSQHNLGQQGFLSNLLGYGLRPSMETAYFPQQSSEFSQLLSPLLGSLGGQLGGGLPGLLSQFGSRLFGGRQQQAMPQISPQDADRLIQLLQQMRGG